MVRFVFSLPMKFSIDSIARVSPSADIEDSSRGSSITIGSDSIVDSFAMIRPLGGVGNPKIGCNSVINSDCVIKMGSGVELGHNVIVVANCVFAPLSHSCRLPDIFIRDQGFAPGRDGIILEDDVWSGAGGVLWFGAILRSDCVIGAMTLVLGEIAANSINVSSSIKRIGWRT